MSVIKNADLSADACLAARGAHLAFANLTAENICNKMLILTADDLGLKPNTVLGVMIEN